MSRCTGACCVAFPISMDLDRLRDRWPWITDAERILEMLVPLTIEQADVEREAAGAAPIPEAERDRTHYDCIHYDDVLRKCGNYANRPIMCHSYPDGTPCLHCGMAPIGVNALDLVAIAEGRGDYDEGWA